MSAASQKNSLIVSMLLGLGTVSILNTVGILMGSHTVLDVLDL